MGKLIIGVLVLFLLIWFLRGAVQYFRGRRKIDNAEVRLESARNDLKADQLNRRAEELEGQLTSAPKAESPTVETTETE